MNISKQKLSEKDVKEGSINNQKTYYDGKSCVEADVNKVFFISSVAIAAGSTVKIEDANGDDCLEFTGQDLAFPIRMDAGFTATSSSDFSLVYFFVQLFGRDLI